MLNQNQVTTTEPQVAIVTGSARNIGRAIALRLAQKGKYVVINGRTKSDELDSLHQEILSLGGKSAICIADISTEQGSKQLIQTAIDHFEKVDILINNAALRRNISFSEMDYSAWREVMQTILDGAYLCSSAALPFLRESKMGSIIFMGGMSAHTGSKDRAHVVAAKMGLVGLTKALSHDLSQYGINVNCVVPGLIETVRGDSAGVGSPEHHKKNTTLIGRRGTVDEVAQFVEFLCSDQARYITGQTLHANGGAYLA
jgi:3-oxoacyl-[acyl-carrier protein] reductase